MKIKNILAIEISTELNSVAIQYKKKIFTKYQLNKKKKHKYILVLIKNIIKKNNINIKKINYFLINKGPGSIISKNISYNIAQIFSLKYKNIKIIKTNTFDIMYKNINNIKYKKYYIIIYNSILNIYICYIKKNNLIYKKNISIKKIKLFFHKKKVNIITNKYQSKKKIQKIIKKKKIKVIYPKAKYMILNINNN